MWNDRQSWWAKKAKEQQTDKTHYKNWCVIHEGSGMVILNMNGQVKVFKGKYKACAKLNTPKYHNPATGKYEANIKVDNLTKQEAYEVAKGLNFLDGEAK